LGSCAKGRRRIGSHGPQAASIDWLEHEAQRQNRAIATAQAELAEAKKRAAQECVKLGPRCQAWQTRVDKLVTEVNGGASVTVNPKAEAIARIANIAGLDQLKVQEFVKAIDPVSMPLFLEAGSILFLMTVFAKRRKS